MSSSLEVKEDVVEWLVGRGPLPDRCAGGAVEGQVQRVVEVGQCGTLENPSATISYGALDSLGRLDGQVHDVVKWL